MKEGNGYNSAEAGPSTFRPQTNFGSSSQPISGWNTSDLPRDERYEAQSDQQAQAGDEEDTEEDMREEESAALEDVITLSSPPSRHRPHLSSKSSSSLTSRPPASQTRSYTKSPHHLPSLSLGAGLHTSSSEIFDLSTSASPSSGGPRTTTYSSLPPSPRGGDGYELSLPPSDNRGLGINDLESALGKLGSNPRSANEGDANVEEEQVNEEEERYWPARSRRATVGEEELHHHHHALSDSHLHFGSPEIEREAQISSPEPGPESEEPNAPGVKVDPSGKIEVNGIWDLLKDEIGAEEWDGWVVDGKWERIANFLAVPLAVEKTTLFGALLCLDGFLYNFTVLPIRSMFALTRIVTRIAHRKAWWPIPTAHLHSILRMLLLVIPTIVLLVATDASKMYHTVRGQDTIKLYVIFNALEIADRLCCAFGQDVLDTLFAKETLSPTVRKRGKGRKRQQARPAFFFALSLGYVLTHALIFFYMLVSLNVAINSYDYTLLSLLISNQFVEIKGSVFKKFEKENLFQIMCADIVERFQLSLMLSVIALRNMIEMAGSDIAFLPKSFIRGKSLVDSILSPVLFVIFSEMIVDWLKHAFISKFNHVRASVYERFTDVLAKDVLLAGSTGSGQNRMRGRNHQVLLDQSPLVARRLGFASIPLACLVIRISAQAIGMLTTTSHHTDESMADLTAGGWLWTALKWSSWGGVAICAWGCLVFLKIILGLALLSFSATRQEGMEAREAEDVVNDFGRAPVGESKEETEYKRQTNQYLSNSKDDLPAYSSPGSVHTPTTPFPLDKSAVLNNARRVNGTRSLGEGAVPGPKYERTLSNPGAGGSRRPNERDDGGGDGDGDGQADREKAKKGKGKKWKLEEVERWTMVKRIW